MSYRAGARSPIRPSAGSASRSGDLFSPAAHYSSSQPGRFYNDEYSCHEELTSGVPAVRNYEKFGVHTNRYDCEDFASPRSHPSSYIPRSRFDYGFEKDKFGEENESRRGVGNSRKREDAYDAGRRGERGWKAEDERVERPRVDERLQETAILGDDSSAEGEEEREMVQRSRHVSDDQGGSSSDEESEDPEFLEQQERERIVTMYDKGPENMEIDSWENPDFDLYDKTDRHGFVHKDGTKLTKAELDKREKERIGKEVRREKKWLSMLKQWEGRRPVKKLEERVWKGIPTKLRIMVWPRLLGVEELKRQSRGDKVYEELLVRARLVSKDIKQIDLDINRTYRDHLAFRRRYDVKQQSLLNVLSAYSMYNTEVGYCQGMSQIAALFLMFLDEEDAFWCLHSLMVSPKHTMHGFFVPGFPKLQRFEAHFKRVLKKYKTRIYKHLEKQDIPYIYLTKWWFGCFLDRVPFPLALRLWDVFLLEGDVILTAMALNIMKMHEKSIRKLGIENFMEFIQTGIAEDFGYSEDEVMRSLREVLTKLRNDRLHQPAPPEKDALPEVPTKAFGPVLARRMDEIRAQLAEVQSRASRANSVATGRTPQARRRGTNGSRLPPSPTPRRAHNAAEGLPFLNRSRGEDPPNRVAPTEGDVPFEVPVRRTPSASGCRQWPSTPPPDPRQPPSRFDSAPFSPSSSCPGGRGIPMGVPAHQHHLAHVQTTPVGASHFVPQSTDGMANGFADDGFRRNRGSTYDNVNDHGAGHNGGSMNIRDENTGKMVCVMRANDDEDESGYRMRKGSAGRGEKSGRSVDGRSLGSRRGSTRVTHSANHVTYISVGEDEGQSVV